MKDFLFKLDIIGPAVLLLLSVFFIKKEDRPPSLQNIIIILFFLTELVLNSTAAILQDRSISNLWVYHLNCFAIQCVFTNYFFIASRRKKDVFLTFILFITIAVILHVKLQPFNSFPSYTYALGSLIIIWHTFNLLETLMDTVPEMQIFSLKDFWIIAGLLTYFGSSFFIFISYEYLTRVSLKSISVLWQLHNIFLCLGCILFTKAFNCKKWVPK